MKLLFPRWLLLFVLAVLASDVRSQMRQYHIPELNIQVDESMIPVKGHALAVRHTGQGQPVLVFIHGYASSQRMWNGLMNEFDRDCRVVSYDRSGYGGSGTSGQGGDGIEQADQLLTILDSLKIDRAVLVAHSYGAHIARLFVDRYPRRCEGLVLLDPAHEDTRIRMAEILIGADLELFQKMESMMPPVRGGAAVDRATREVTFAALRAIERQPGCPGLLLSATQRPVMREFSAAAQSRLKKNDLEQQEELAGKCCQGNLIWVPDAGHHVHLDNPDFVTERIRAFVSNLQK